MLPGEQLIEKENIGDDRGEFFKEKITFTGNDPEEDKNAREELFEDDLYVWNLLLLSDKKE